MNKAVFFNRDGTINRIDSIMKKVEQHYRGDFSINGEQDLTQRVRQMLSQKSVKKFNGYNGTFGVDKMFYSPECEQNNGIFCIPKGGVVYGPYYPLSSGEYFVSFYVTAMDAFFCSVEVTSSNVGRVVYDEVRRESGEVEPLLLSFTLKEPMEDMEFKLFNLGDEIIQFEKIVISDHLISEKKVATKQIVNRDRYEVDDTLLNEAMSGLIADDLHLITELTRASQTAYCVLPEYTKMRGIKQFFRKLLNSYIQLQVEFNTKIVRICKTMGQKTKLLTDSIVLLWVNQKNMANCLSQMEESMRKTEEQIVQLTQKLAGEQKGNAEQDLNLRMRKQCILDLERMDHTPCNDHLLQKLRETPIVLFVGEMDSRQNIEDILDVFENYHRYYNKKAKLFLVGNTENNDNYRNNVMKKLEQLKSKENIMFIDKVNESDLYAYYRAASAFFCMSEHEGFCIPLLEAMNFKVPVLAYASCAVRDIMGCSGILLNSKNVPTTATLLDLLLTDKQLRYDIIEKQNKNIQLLKKWGRQYV